MGIKNEREKRDLGQESPKNRSRGGGGALPGVCGGERRPWLGAEGKGELTSRRKALFSSEEIGGKSIEKKTQRRRGKREEEKGGSPTRSRTGEEKKNARKFS